MPEAVPLTENQLRALRLLGECTRQRPFDIWCLSGDYNAGMRQQILQTFYGTKWSRAKSGIGAIRAAFYEALAITGQCEAEREENFTAKAKELTANAV